MENRSFGRFMVVLFRSTPNIPKRKLVAKTWFRNGFRVFAQFADSRGLRLFPPKARGSRTKPPRVYDKFCHAENDNLKTGEVLRMPSWSNGPGI